MIRLAIKFNKIKKFFIKIPRILGERAFLTFLILILLTLIFGGIVFYKYSFSIAREKLKISEQPLRFNEKAFQEVLKIWQDRQKKFEETKFKEYPDPFIIPEELTK